MIVAFSTSSPVASVAVFDREGRLVASERMEAPRNASGACLAMLERLFDIRAPHSEVTGFAADTGPGSFIGTRVGVTLAKTLAYGCGVGCYGMTSFDLIDCGSAVVVPNRKGEWFLRDPGSPPRLTSELPVGTRGYGHGIEPATFPDASRFQLPSAHSLRPEELLPTYLVEPSISQPKKPFAGAVE